MDKRQVAQFDAPLACGGLPLALAARQLAGQLGVSVRTIRTWDYAGKLPRAVRFSNGTVRWLLAEIEEWLAAGAPDRVTWEARKSRLRLRQEQQKGVHK